jgi:hypothetical protein
MRITRVCVKLPQVTAKAKEQQGRSEMPEGGKSSSSQGSSADEAARHARMFFCEITKKSYYVGSWRPDACA